MIEQITLTSAKFDTLESRVKDTLDVDLVCRFRQLVKSTNSYPYRARVPSYPMRCRIYVPRLAISPSQQNP